MIVVVALTSLCAQVHRDGRGIPMVRPADAYAEPDPKDLLTLVYDCGPVQRVWYVRLSMCACVLSVRVQGGL